MIPLTWSVSSPHSLTRDSPLFSNEVRWNCSQNASLICPESTRFGSSSSPSSVHWRSSASLSSRGAAGCSSGCCWTAAAGASCVARPRSRSSARSILRTMYHGDAQLYAERAPSSKAGWAAVGAGGLSLNAPTL